MGNGKDDKNKKGKGKPGIKKEYAFTPSQDPPKGPGGGSGWQGGRPQGGGNAGAPKAGGHR